MSGKLKDELKKQGAFDSLEQEAALNVLRTADRLHNRLGRLLREFGLTPSQYNVLRILRGAGQPLPSLEIAERLIQVVPAITGLIDRLEDQSLVRRERLQDDRRVVHVALTPKGRKLLGQIDQPLRELHKSLMGHLTRAELQELVRLTEKARTWPDD
ncbi:MAG TPA: MarR family transcriptional regulator [Pirellulaceae bacterium]|nr:MarR family transcriptional regulator [Pirellulaceae bacterium]